jgi:hypothetical protein
MAKITRMNAIKVPSGANKRKKYNKVDFYPIAKNRQTFLLFFGGGAIFIPHEYVAYR